MVMYDIFEYNWFLFFKFWWVVVEGLERKVNDIYCIGYSFCKLMKLIVMLVIVFMFKILFIG